MKFKLSIVMKRFLLIVFVILINQGCWPVALVVGGAVGTVVHDNRSTRTIVEDRDIVFRIQSKFNSDEELSKDSHLCITSFNYIVLLVGQVPNEELRKHAEDLAKSDSRVRLVYNEISVGKPLGDLAKANDTWITAKTKTVLVSTSGLRSTSMKIVTEDGVIYLMGLTTKSQGNLAAKKARTVAGGRKIVKLFEYMN